MKSLAGWAETADVPGIVARVAQLGPECAALAKSDAGWPAETRETLVRSGAAVAAKWLNKSPVGGEYQPEVELTVAVLGLYSARTELLTALRQLAAEAEAARAAAKTEAA